MGPLSFGPFPGCSLVLPLREPSAREGVGQRGGLRGRYRRGVRWTKESQVRTRSTSGLPVLWFPARQPGAKAWLPMDPGRDPQKSIAGLRAPEPNLFASESPLRVSFPCLGSFSQPQEIAPQGLWLNGFGRRSAVSHIKYRNACAKDGPHCAALTEPWGISSNCTFGNRQFHLNNNDCRCLEKITDFPFHVQSPWA